MQNEFLPYDRALRLKELGFDKPCISYYTAYGNFSNDYSAPRKYNSEFELGSYISAPTFSQAFRWFREEHGLGHMINGIGYESFLFNIGGLVTVFPMFKTYEEAELACLDKLIEIVEIKEEGGKH